MIGLVAWAAQPARALVVVANGDTVDGWTIVVPNGVTVLQEDQFPTLTLETTSAFNSLAPQELMFIQNSYNASGSITIDKQSITNSTGTTMIGMKAVVSTMLNPVGPAAVINQTFNLSNPARTKFTTETSIPGGIFYHGALPNHAASQLGYGATNDLVINANPAGAGGLKKIFVFRETAIPVVPVPPAVWTGLSGLLGLGLIAGVRKFIRLHTGAGSAASSLA
jgi:hypothetical protein